LLSTDQAAWKLFSTELQAIVDMVNGGPPAEYLLGLPLEHECESARVRQRVATDIRAAGRVKRLEALALTLLGDRAQNWLAGRAMDELSPRETARWGETELDELTTELQMLHQTHQKTARLLAEKQGRQDQLKNKAENILGVERAALFLRNFHPILGRSPLENLESSTGLRQVLDILTSIKRRQARRR